MAIEINNNTIIRLIVRRGSEDDRKLATLAAGELAFTVDTQRLFVGVDGQVGTGVVAGNKFLGVVSNRALANDIAQIGDMVFDTNANQLYALSADSAWASISPALYNLENTSNGTRVNKSIAGVGLNLAYDVADVNNIFGTYDGKIQFDSRYLSVDTSNNNRLYVGNVADNTYNYGANTKLIVDGITYINNGTGQIVLSASNNGTSLSFNNSAGSYGTTYINVASSLKLVANSPVIAGSAAILAVSSYPGFDFSGGCGVFRNGLLVQGGLVADFFSSATANTLSLTSISIDTTNAPSLTALIIRNSTGTSTPVLIDVKKANKPILFANCNPFVGIHTSNYGQYGGSYNTAISGSTLNIGNATVSGGNLTVYGDISATGDIVGFFSSDASLKQNINPITNALDKLLSLKGVEFDWNEKSIYKGHDVGVLAQDVKDVLPSAVGKRYDGYMGVQYDKIIPLIIEAIRELKSSK